MSRHTTTLDELIAALERAREKVGGEVGVACVMPWGEMDFGIAELVVTGNFCDQDGLCGNIAEYPDDEDALERNVHCAIFCDEGGEEFSRQDMAHYDYEEVYREDRV